MAKSFNVYCDESCHLENDGEAIMVLGGLWCPTNRRRKIFADIRSIKVRHGMPANRELKWTKISPSMLPCYTALVDYFFDSKDLHFRALVADKTNLAHEMFNQDHDDWYHKMYYLMLRNIFMPNALYSVYVDIKDTKSAEKIDFLHQVVCFDRYDFNKDFITKIQPIHSSEVEILQLADILIGAVSAHNRGITRSEAKNHLIDHIKERSGYSLTKNTPVREEKFSMFFWQGQGDSN